jgi:hypothetical protein
VHIDCADESTRGGGHVADCVSSATKKKKKENCEQSGDQEGGSRSDVFEHDDVSTIVVQQTARGLGH